MAEAFLMVDANKDKVITKKEGEDAATSNFDRKDDSSDSIIPGQRQKTK